MAHQRDDNVLARVFEVLVNADFAGLTKGRRSDERELGRGRLFEPTFKSN